MSEQMNPNPSPEEELTAEQAAEQAEEATKEEEACPSIFDKPDPDRYKTKTAKPKKKSRHVTRIIVAAVLCVAIVLSGEGIAYLTTGQWLFHYVADYFTNTESETSSDPTKDEPTDYVFDYSSYMESPKDTEALGLGGISSILVQNETGTYTLTSKMGTQTVFDEQTYEEYTKEALEWLITGVQGADITGVTFDPSTVGFIVTDLLKIPYASVYAQDGTAQIPQGGMTYYAECGLDRAKVQCTINFNNGASVKVSVGDKTPTGDDYFMSVESNDGNHPEALGAPKQDRQIYRVTSAAVAFFLKAADYYVDREIITMVEQDESTYNEFGDEVEDPYFVSGALSYFDALSVSGRSYPRALSFKNVEESLPGYDSIYLMTAPITQNVNLDAMETLLGPVADGLTAATCLTMRATAADLQKYGLSSPACTVRYVVKGKEYVLSIGNKTNEEENCYAVMVKGNPSIFEVLADDIAFKDYDTADYASNTIYSCDITKVKTISIRCGNGINETFRLTHGKDDSGDPSLTVVTQSGKTISTEDFRTMYVNLLSLTSFTNVTDGKDAANPYVTVTLTYNDYSQVDVLRLSAYTDRRYFMSLNGMGSTVVLSNNVDTFVNSVSALLK